MVSSTVTNNTFESKSNVIFVDSRSDDEILSSSYVNVVTHKYILLKFTSGNENAGLHNKKHNVKNSIGSPESKSFSDNEDY